MEKLAQAAYTLLGIRLSPAQLSAFSCYEQELLEWNSRFNLTAIESPEEVRIKHFLDSLTCWLVMRDAPVSKVVDVGTGAGFPGLPLKIFNPRFSLSLIESVGKKAAFCNHLIQKLRLEDVRVIQERAEAVGQNPEHREGYDWAIARAVANLPVLMEFLLPLVRVGGKALAMKGSNAPAEAQMAERAIRLLGGKLQRLLPITLPGVAEERYLVVVDKIAVTPKNYPRRVGVPARKPLT